MHMPSSNEAVRTSHTSLVPSTAIVTDPHRVHFFGDMGPMLRCIARDIRRATDRVWIETYIFRSDRLARALAASLAQAARRGADVRLLYDPMGCNETDPAIFRWLEARGVSVRAYRDKQVAFDTGAWFPRDHARLVVIDDVAYTGGAAWGDEWLPRELGGQGWHDVCLRVAGPCVDDFRIAFERRWSEACGEIVVPTSYATGTRYPDLEFVNDTPGPNRIVYQRYLDSIERARERVWIENAYFFPPAELLAALVRARRRGVDVQIILPLETDLPIIRHAAHAEIDEWLEAGFTLYGYARSVLHSKFALVDEAWCTIGTFNANPFSVYYSNEANIFFYDPAAVRRVAAIFDHDRAGSQPIVRGSPHRRRRMMDQVRDRFAQAAIAIVEAVARVWRNA
jgi:cardiolipin synthase